MLSLTDGSAAFHARSALSPTAAERTAKQTGLSSGPSLDASRAPPAWDLPSTVCVCVCAPSPFKLARAGGSVAIFFTLLDFSLAPEGAGAELADVASTLSNQSHHGLFTVLGTWRTGHTAWSHGQTRVVRWKNSGSFFQSSAAGTGVIGASSFGATPRGCPRLGTSA